MEETSAEKTCPQCGQVLKVLLFMGVQPDGYVCERCELYFNDDLKPLARVLFCDGGDKA
jgi:hypothetical protein